MKASGKASVLEAPQSCLRALGMPGKGSGGILEVPLRGSSEVPQRCLRNLGGAWEVRCLEGGLDRHQRSLKGASEVHQKCLRTALASLREALEVLWRCLRNILGMP